MTRLIQSLLLLTFAAVVVSCGQADKTDQQSSNVSLYVEDPAVTESDSALNAYVASVDGDYDFDGLKGIYEEYVEKYPNSTDLQRSFQDIYFMYDMQDSLTDRYKAEFESNPNSAMYAYLYGRALDDDSTAIGYFRKATELDPEFFWGWYGLAATLSRDAHADTAGAIEAYKQAIAADNSQPSSYRFIGRLYKAQGNLDTALVYFDLMSQTQPDNMRSLSPKIDLLKDMGRYAEAETELTAFLFDNPDDYSASMELVDVLDEQGRYADAIPRLQDLIETPDRKGSAYYKMMTIRCKLGQPDSALAALDGALASGFDDYRAVMHDPELAPMREASGYAEIKTTMQDSISAMKARRDEERSADREKRKEDALAEMIDEPAAEFSLVDLYGNTVTLSELKGNVVILDFWATWCGPCRLTMPLLQEFNDMRGDDMKYFSVNVWETDTTEVRPYLSKYGYTFNCLFGEAGTAGDYGVNGIPTMVMIDKHGSVRFKHVGYRPDMDEVLGWQLDELLKMN